MKSAYGGGQLTHNNPSHRNEIWTIAYTDARIYMGIGNGRRIRRKWMRGWNGVIDEGKKREPEIWKRGTEVRVFWKY